MDLDGVALAESYFPGVSSARLGRALYDFLHSRDAVTTTMPLSGMTALFTALKLRHGAADPEARPRYTSRCIHRQPGEYLSVTGLGPSSLNPVL